MEGIDYGIACNEDLAVGLFFLKVVLAERCGSKVIGGNAACNLAIHLLRPRAVDVVSAQACLNMANGNLLIECSEGGSG